MKIASQEPLVWSRVAPYLDRALDLEPNERETWFAELTTTEPDLAQAVRKLLAECQQLDAKGFLEQSPAADLATIAGTRIGAYTVDRLIGRGGMGEVWLATRSDGRFEGQCAIKFLDASVASVKLADRFRREGSLLARLTHPNIARLIDAGAADGRPYLALEYVDGERIDYYCKSKALSIDERVRLFVDVVAAVAHAHTHLIVHRDLKPSNVMITRDGQVKLLDFGIAKLLSAETAVDEATLTRIEDAALTPEYAAPEQLLGELPSTATDVYQLGMLLYVLLTGQHPLQQSGTRAEKIRAALDGIVPRASELADSPIRKQLRGDLDAILAMALRKLPNERYATAQTLQDELVRYLNHEPVLARRGATWYRARKFVSRHRFAVGTSAVAALGLCAALAFALLQAREAERQRDRAQLETKKAEADRRFTESMMSEIGEPDKPITPRQVLEKGLQLLETQYSDDPDFVVRTLIGMSGRFMDMGDRQGEYDALVKAEGIARQHGDLLSLAHVQCNTVETEIALGRLDRAEARLAEGKDLLSRASGVSVGDRVDCLHAAASLSDAQGRTNDAIRDVESSAALLEQNGLTTDIRYAPLLQHLAGLYASLGNTKMSYEYNHRATLAMEKSGRTGTVAWEAQMHNEAIDLRDCGELLAAFDAESKVLNRNLARSPNDDLPAPVILAYAGLLVRLDRTTEAMPWLDRAQAVAVRAGDRGMIMAAHVIRGKALLLQNRIEPASAEIKIVTDIAGDDLNGFRALIARARLFHADVLVVQAKLADANRIVVSVLEQTRNPELGLGIYLDDALLGASRVASAQGRHADAESLAREALQIDESRARDPAQSADVGEAALQLASIKSQMNDRKTAIDLAARASIALGNSVGAEHSLTRAAQRLHTQLVQ